MKKMIIGLSLPLHVLWLCVVVMGCGASASYHTKQVQDNSVQKMTVGDVQREIYVGMSGSDVVSVLGSPNIVTTDEKRRETWVYDKMASIRAYSTSPGKWLIGGEAGATSSSQKTLTIIIKFDDDKKVRDFAYHSSSF
jgi:outer membrane protein assembly factor BamE (lipoprotein component of BamABCDE complex)